MLTRFRSEKNAAQGPAFFKGLHKNTGLNQAALMHFIILFASYKIYRRRKSLSLGKREALCYSALLFHFVIEEFAGFGAGYAEYDGKFAAEVVFRHFVVAAVYCGYFMTFL